MSLPDGIEIPRKTMVLFFVVDTSGSMYGEKIGSVNYAIEEVIPELRDLNEDQTDALIKVAVLQFSSGTEWLTKSGPVEVENYKWEELNAGGSTDLGAACAELNSKLSTKAFMQEAAGSYAPAIFLLSDGEPTDQWADKLRVLKENNWFKNGIKCAIAIGTAADKAVLAEFTGNPETVVEVKDSRKLRDMIKFIAVTSSQVASGDTSTGSKQEAIAEMIKEHEEEYEAGEVLSAEDDGDIW
jgi:uncharacterized protein YegL